jgi:hypothetical protein
VRVISGWEGFSFPGPPVAALAVTLVGMVDALLPSGRPRSRGKWAVGGVLFVLGVARLYLAVEHPTDLLAAVILGVAVPVVAFRFFTPNEVFPVTYRRAKTAHLDVGGRRGQAIRTAVQEQLGLTVLDVQPVGLEGSAGSTPLRLRIAASDGAPERDLFAKLYAKPRPRRPVPQGGPHDPVRRAGGRGPLPVGPPLCRVRGLHAAAAAPRRHPGAGP